MFISVRGCGLSYLIKVLFNQILDFVTMVALLIPISYRNKDSQVDIYRHSSPGSSFLLLFFCVQGMHAFDFFLID